VRLPERIYRWCRRRPIVSGLAALSTLLAVAFVGTVIAYEIRLNAALAREVARESREIAEQKQELGDLHVHIGISLMEEGDDFAAIFQFTEALKADEGTEREPLDRTRIGVVLRHCPQLQDVVAFERPILCAGRDRVVTVGDGQTLDVRPIRNGPPMVSGLAQTDQACECTLSPDGKLLGMAMDDGFVRICDLSNRESHELNSSSPEKVQRLIFHPAGRVAIVQRAAGEPERWDLSKWTRLPWASLSVFSAFSLLSDDGRWLFACRDDHTAQVWDTATGKPTGAPLSLGHEVKAVGIAPDGHILVVVNSENELSIWDVSSNNRLGKPTKLRHDVGRIAISPDGARIAMLNRDHTLQIRQTHSGEVLAEIPATKDPAASLTFSPDGRFLLGMAAGDARIWDTVAGRAVTPSMHHGGSLVFFFKQKTAYEIITVSKRGLVCFWELPRGPEMRTDLAVEVGATSGAKGQVVTLANGITVRAQGAAEGTLEPPRRETRTIEKAVLSPDRRHIAVCEDANTVLIVNVASGATETLPLRHRCPVLYVAFSSDGSRLLTACDDRSIRLWDVTHGQPLSPSMSHSLPIERVFFKEGDTRAYVVHKGGAVSIWDLKQDDHRVKDLAELAGKLADQPGGPKQK